MKRLLPLHLLITFNTLKYINCLSQLSNRRYAIPIKQNLSHNNEKKQYSRRSMLHSIILPTLIGSSIFNVATKECIAKEIEEITFKSEAFGLREYTNSVTASRDTNISPFEAYDVIQSAFSNKLDKRNMRALDLGAGAGASTELLWKLGYHNIDAVDWSGKAWDKFVTSPVSTVKFYEMDSDSFYSNNKPFTDEKKYNAVVFNYAVNEDKAKKYAREMLVADGGLLLAPVNIRRDYWFQQIYKSYDSNGDTQRVFGNTVGAWEVLFQPDVSETSCQGIWCPPFNGFKK